MLLSKLVGCSAVVALGAMFAAIVPTQATMYHTQCSTPFIQHVDCASDFHFGPVGTGVIGTGDPPPPAVIERCDDNVGCETKSVTKQDASGNSMTKTRTNC
jgi:hypothetical protein